MHALKELKEKFHNELEKIARKAEMSISDVETVHKLTDTIKNIDKIYMLEESKGYSGDGDWTAHGTYGRRGGMERYSRDGNKEHMISKLEDMMSDADSEKMKTAIRRCISEIERN